MRKIGLSLTCVVLAMLLASGLALGLPSETPDPTLMVNGPVRTIEQVGTNVWVGGNFAQVNQPDGTVIDDVANVAVFDSETGEYVDIAPELGDEGSAVWDMEVYGDDLVIAGEFAGPSAEAENLVLVDGTTGAVIRWYDSEVLRSALAAPELGRIYGGGRSLTAFDLVTGEKLWTRAKTIIDRGIRLQDVRAAYRDMELGANGQTIWAACGCDAVVAPDGTPNAAKALVKLDTEGNHAASWVTQAEPEAFGLSLADDKGGMLYLAAGGNDFLAAYSKVGGGVSSWIRDTSGSAQVVEVVDGQLVVGGHFWEVADQADEDCGHRSANDDLTLDPYDECQTRKGLAAYSFSGTLEPNWEPALMGKYMLAWTVHPEVDSISGLPTGRLHVGGEFTRVNELRQEYYTRLSPELLP